jgi:hypothetical protein
MVASGFRLGVPRGSIFHFELPVYQSRERKPDVSDGSPASAPSLVNEAIE